MIKVELTPGELTALKELAAARPRGRKGRAVRRDLARLIRAQYVTEQSASMDTVVCVITYHYSDRRTTGDMTFCRISPELIAEMPQCAQPAS
jgi:hypothetical protein